MSSCARPISEKWVSQPFLKSGFSNIFVGINIGNIFSAVGLTQIRVACRGGLRREILLENDLLKR